MSVMAEAETVTTGPPSGPIPKFGVLCDFASLGEDGKLNLLGIFTDVRPPALPYVVMQMSVVVVYEVGPEGLPEPFPPLSISLRDPLGQPMFTVDTPVVVRPPRHPPAPGRERVNHLTGFVGLQLPMAGEYQFEINWGANLERVMLPLYVHPVEEVQS